jgi:hypothetical protein
MKRMEQLTITLPEPKEERARLFKRMAEICGELGYPIPDHEVGNVADPLQRSVITTKWNPVLKLAGQRPL